MAYLKVTLHQSLCISKSGSWIFSPSKRGLKMYLSDKILIETHQKIVYQAGIAEIQDRLSAKALLNTLLLVPFLK